MNNEEPIIEDLNVPEEVMSDHPEYDWYVIQVYTAHEEKVKSLIELGINSNSFKSKIASVFIPLAEISTIKAGKKQTSLQKKYPGYVFIQLKLDIDTWHYINEINGVIGFIGDENRTSKKLTIAELADVKKRVKPLSKDEVKSLTRTVKDGEKAKDSKLDLNLEEGSVVEIIDGPFSDFKGQISEINRSKGKVKVIVNIFGRPTPVELDFVQIRQI
jgi:transcription termination/antitermination protein NusG